MTIHPDRIQPVAVPEHPGPALVRLLQELTLDPFCQAAVLRLYGEAPRLLSAVERLRITAAIRADNATIAQGVSDHPPVVATVTVDDHDWSAEEQRYRADMDD